jgi:hypothetical protein
MEQQDPNQMGRAELIEAAHVARRVGELVEQWRTDPNAFPDGAADVLEQIATALTGDCDA